MKYGDPLAGGIVRDKKRQIEPCEIDGCAKRRYARRMCDLHYTRWRKFGDPLRERPAFVRLPCKIDACEQPAMGRGWCASHYQKWKRHGDPLWESTPQSRRRVVSTRRDGGYVMFYRPEHPNARCDGRIAEHTVVMADQLGRALMPNENVHHKNGIRSDNRPANLELWIKAQPAGQRVSDLIEFANWITKRYGTDPTAYP